MIQSDPVKAISDADSAYENRVVKVIASRNISDIRIEGSSESQIEEGQEFETRHWIASHLVNAGLAHIKSNMVMVYPILYKIHWKETKLQTGRRISGIPEYFYPQLRRYLESIKQHISTDVTRSNEYYNAQRLAHDIINCRLRKIVNLAASTSLTGEMLQKLSIEERVLFDRLQSIISAWKSQILVGNEET